MSGFWRDLVPLLIVLGGIVWAAYAIPFALAAAALVRGSRLGKKWYRDGWVWGFTVAAVVSVLVITGAVAEKQAACDQLKKGVELETVLPNLTGPSSTLEYINKCG